MEGRRLGTTITGTEKRTCCRTRLMAALPSIPASASLPLLLVPNRGGITSYFPLVGITVLMVCLDTRSGLNLRPLLSHNWRLLNLALRTQLDEFIRRDWERISATCDSSRMASIISENNEEALSAPVPIGMLDLSTLAKMPHKCDESDEAEDLPELQHILDCHTNLDQCFCQPPTPA